VVSDSLGFISLYLSLTFLLPCSSIIRLN
jgi:hypothetical protein